MASRKQSCISYFIIFLLCCITVALAFKQQHIGISAIEDTILKDALFGDKFNPTTDIENYSSANLYEKIDGKADLYLNNGFVSLQWRRFNANFSSDKWVEVYLYDMGKIENAFAVYSIQKRADGQPLEWAKFGCTTSDALYTIAGKYYIEALISTEDSSLLADASQAIKDLASLLSSGNADIPYLHLFPTENLDVSTFKFISSDAFGSQLKNIFAAEYKISSSKITAYMCKDITGEIYNYYCKFLIDNGGTELKTDCNIPQYKAVDLFGTREIVFKTANYFAGVRSDSVGITDLKKIAETFFKSLSEQK